MSVVGIFFIVLITAFAVFTLVTEPSKEDKLVHARLSALDQKDVYVGESQPDIVKQVIFSTIPAFDKFLRHNRVAVGLQLLIEQCDLKWTVGRVVFTSLLLVCAGALVGNWWIAPGMIGWLPGLALGAVPYLYLFRKRGKRFLRFNELLPEAIDLMSRGLRAGQALPLTIDMVARESDDPIRSEFRRAADETSFGLPFREAMMNLARRIPVSDLQFLVTAILVQKETGGNLAEILDKTSRVIRERVRIAGEMRIRSAQGRLTAKFLCGMPFAIFIGMNFMSPGYGKVLFESPAARNVLMGAGVMMAIGVVVIRRIVNVKF